ncbi:MAG: hypothetical protein AAGF12_24940 [Myxococcota bacterium]
MTVVAVKALGRPMVLLTIERSGKNLVVESRWGQNRQYPVADVSTRRLAHQLPETFIDPPVLELKLSSRRTLLIAGDGVKPWPEPDGDLVWREPRYRTTSQDLDQLMELLT